MSKDELLARFTTSWHAVRHLPSPVILSRTDLTNTNPNNEGMAQVQLFEIEGDLLILTSCEC